MFPGGLCTFWGRGPVRWRFGKPNPRGKKLDKQPGSGPRFGSPLIYVLLLLVGFLLLRSLFQDVGFQRVPYRRLLERVQRDGCQKVVLSNDWVKCYPKACDAQSKGELPWFAVRVSGDTTLIKTLQDNHIEFDAVSESGMSEMIWMLIVPIGIGLLFVSWLTRRMSGGMPGGPPGVMSFGKTKARVYMESNTGVTFKDVAGVDEAADELKEIVEFLKMPSKFRRLGGHDEREQTLNQMLAEMDGFDSRTALIVLAATNRPEILDPALMRPGRFDRQVLVDRPDRKGREEILRIHSREVKLGADVDLKLVAARTPGFAGADLANVVNEAALLAARKDRDKVVMADFMEAIERVVAGLEKKNRRMNEKEEEIVAYHESGHAVVSTLLTHSEPGHKISIIPRGLAALGYTMQLPLEDRYLMSPEELLDKMGGLMGGRAAEEIVVGSISTGASNDFKQATEIARLMGTEYGMSEALGPVNYAGRGRSPFLRGADGMAGLTDKAYSERTQRRIDEEVSRLVEEAMQRARDIVSHHREALGRVAARLLQNEAIEGDELRPILTESGALPAEKKGPAAEAGREQRESA